MEQIRCLVGHQELRAVGGAQNQRPSRAQSRHDHRVFDGYFALVQKASYLATITRRRNRGLHSDGQTVQWPSRFFRFIQLTGLLTNAICIEVGECVQLRVQAFDLLYVRLGQLHHGDLAGTQ